MKFSYDQICNGISDFLSESGRKYYSDFYIGITDNYGRRLKEHNVDPKELFGYRWFEAYSKEVAESVERCFINKGMVGAPGGGNVDSVYVYCYKITPSTIESVIG